MKIKRFSFGDGNACIRAEKENNTMPKPLKLHKINDQGDCPLCGMLAVGEDEPCPSKPLNQKERKTMHTHAYSRSKPSATVETCTCGKFRHTENAGPSIEAIDTLNQKPRVSHTPGPWQVVEVGVDELFIATGKPSDDGYSYIAEMSKDADYANARLIAAAPDLLFGCETALNDLLAHPDGLKFPGTIKMLRAMIYKAEGRKV